MFVLRRLVKNGVEGRRHGTQLFHLVSPNTDCIACKARLSVLGGTATVLFQLVERVSGRLSNS